MTEEIQRDHALQQEYFRGEVMGFGLILCVIGFLLVKVWDEWHS